MNTVNRIVPFAAIAGLISAAAIGLAAARMPTAPRGPMRPPIDLTAVLNIDAERASRVEEILRATHEKMRAAMEEFGPPADDTSRAELHQIMDAIRSQSDQLLGAILTSDEIARLHEAMRRGPPPRDAVWKRE